MDHRFDAAWARLLGVTLVACACAGETPLPHPGDSAAARPTDSTAPQRVQLIDTAIPPAVAGEAGWNYQQSALADLTGDGEPERVVLTARVELVRGRPAWDDGQPWQVYVEARDGTRTWIYAQRLQLGSLTMRVGRGGAGQAATIVLLEHLPDRLSVYEVSYAGPDSASVAVRYQRELDPRGETATPSLP
jgi:hypothetical protein